MAKLNNSTMIPLFHRNYLDWRFSKWTNKHAQKNYSTIQSLFFTAISLDKGLLTQSVQLYFPGACPKPNWGLAGLNCRYHKDLELLNDSTEPSKTDYKTDPSIFTAIFRIYVCYADVFTLSKTNQKLATMQYMPFLDVCFSCWRIKRSQSGQCNGRSCQSFLFPFLFLCSFSIMTNPRKPFRV